MRLRHACAAALAAVTATALGVGSAGATPEPVEVASHSYTLARAKKVVERRVIGYSVQGRPIVAFRKGNPDARRKVVLLGQMHGNEPAGRVTAAYVRTKLPVDSDVDLWIVPTMNPDGAAVGSRRNARGVDLNRNWPTNGWVPGPRGSAYYPGPKPASEPETRAMLRFLRTVRPRFVASIHQPFGTVARSDKAMDYTRRLARLLGLGVREVSVGTPAGKVSPTLTSWYNQNFEGASVTIEYPRSPSVRFKTVRAGNGILKATFAHW
jgi:protein MpaA